MEFLALVYSSTLADAKSMGPQKVSCPFRTSFNKKAGYQFVFALLVSDSIQALFCLRFSSSSPEKSANFTI